MARFRRPRPVGYVPGLDLYRDLTVEGTPASWPGPTGLVPPLPADPAAARDRLVGEIDLGRQRRLAFTTALARSPSWSCSTSPPPGVDPLARARLWDPDPRAGQAGGPACS